MLRKFMILMVFSVFGVVGCGSADTRSSQAEETQVNKEEQVAAADTETKAKETRVDDRMVCRLERPIGSNRMKKVCRTVDQIREDQRNAQDAMTRRMRSGTGGGGESN